METNSNHNYRDKDKSFKEEDYLSFLMTDENSISDNNNNESYIHYIKDIKDKEFVFKDRKTEGVYMSHRVFEDWIFFCDNIPKKTCDLTEKALLLFMMNYPKQDILVDIEIQEVKKKTVQQEIDDGILCNKLKTWGDRVFELSQRESPSTANGSYVQFLEFIEEAANFKNPSDRLIELMEQYKVLI